MKDEKQKLKYEIAELKKQQSEMRERIKEIERLDRLKIKERQDIASRLKNANMINYIFPYYDNVYEYDGKYINTGKVHLRHWKQMPNDFTAIRNLAKTITYYKSFSRRSDGYVEQSTVKKTLNQLDDEELRLVAECADEIIAVLHKYKGLCEKHQNIDYSEFLIEEK